MSEQSWLTRSFGAQVSTRTLALLRILIPTTLLFQFAYPWVSYKMDDLVGTLLGVWVTFTAAMFVILGYQTRIAAVVMATAFGTLHLYYGYIHGNGIPKLTEPVQVFQALVLLALTPCGRSLSVDRVLEVRRARREGREPAPERMPGWVLELFVIQTSAIYLWGAYDMADSSWLSGTRMQRTYLDLYGASDSFMVQLPAVAQALAYLGLVSAVAIGIGLLIRPIRRYVAAYAVVLQCVLLWIYGLDWDSCYFFMMMTNMLVACLPPESVDRFFTTVIKGATAPATTEAPPRSASTPIWLGSIALGVALVYFHLGPYRAQVRSRPLAPLVWDWKLQR